MFIPDFESQLKYRIERKRKSRRLKRGLSILLICSLMLLTSFEPLVTFSRYVANMSHSFTVSTSEFYLVPSLQFNALDVDIADGYFTQANNFTVANNDGTRVTTHTSAYTISMIENSETPLFDLYTDDGAGGKTICPNNTISDTLAGGLAANTTYALYFKLKDPVTPLASYPVTIELTSSEPYIRSYIFTVNIQLDSSLILIPGTEDIYRPNIEIPEGEIMVFKDNEYEFLTIDDLLVPVIIDDVVVDLSRPDLIGGSLYVPAAIGDIVVNSNQTINWDVAGSIVLESDILANSGNIEVNMLSHNGDIIINQVNIKGTKQKNEPFIVNITAENGGIEANGTIINSKADGDGIINLVAKDDVNISAAEIESDDNYGVYIQSEEGDINASDAVIISNNGATNATVTISAEGQINLDNATVQSSSSSAPPTAALLIESINMGISARNATLTSTSNGKLMEIRAHEFIDLDQSAISSQGALTISSATDINAKSANIISGADAKDILISSTNGGVFLSSLEVADMPQTVMSGLGNIIIIAKGNIEAKSVKMTATKYNNKIEIISSAGQIDLASSTVAGMPITDITAGSGNINIKSNQDIFITSAKITASTGWGMKLHFESTGSNRKLWVQNSSLTGKSITAYNLVITGTTAQGTITIGQ